MVWRLIAHAIRRTGRIYALALFSFLAWWIATVQMSLPWGTVAVSLAVAFVIGPVVAVASLSSREIVLLPVSRRQLWLAQWLLGTVVAVAVNTLAKILGIVSTPYWLASMVSIDAAALALSALCDFAYCGAFLGLLAIAGTRLPARVPSRGTVSSALYALAVVAFLGGIVWPFVMADALPVRWADLAGPGGIVLAAGLMLTVAGCAYVPRAAARSSDRRPAVASGVVTAGGWRDLLFPGATSLKRLLAREGLLALGFVIGMIALMVALQMLPPQRAGLLDALAGVAQPYQETTPIRYAGGLLPWLHAAWFAVLVMSGRNALVPMMRVLRAQPISTWRLNVLFLALSLPVWLGLAAVVSVVEIAALGRQPSIAPGTLILFTGCTALGHAWHLRMRVPARFGGAVIAAMALAGLTALLLRRVPPLDVLADPAALGAVAFAAAAVLNHLAIARRSATYRRPAPGLVPCAPLA